MRHKSLEEKKRGNRRTLDREGQDAEGRTTTHLGGGKFVHRRHITGSAVFPEKGRRRRRRRKKNTRAVIGLEGKGGGSSQSSLRVRDPLPECTGSTTKRRAGVDIVLLSQLCTFFTN